MIESALIVVSILVALGLDEWRDNRQDEELVRFALSNFLSEMQQNKLLVEDSVPFNQGLRSVLSRHYDDNDIASVDDFVTMVESFTPSNLNSAAWETALATGSLAKMEYKIVSTLSVTYNLQNRYLVASRAGQTDAMNPKSLAEDDLRLAAYNSIRYLDSIASMETELGDFYGQAIAVVETAIDDGTAFRD